MEEEVHIIYVDPPEKKKSAGNRFLRKTLWGLGLAFLLLAAASVVIAAFFEEEIGERILAELNQQIETELKVENFELSLLAGFPNVSARLNDVILKDKGKGNLLEANEIAFKIGFFSLFSSNINVKSVKISDGALYIKRDRKGRVNYKIWKEKAPSKEKQASATPSTLGISIEKAAFEDMELIYIDEQLHQEIIADLSAAVVSGQFSASKFNLSSFAELKSKFVELEDGRYLVGKRIVYDADINVDLDKGRYVFEDVNVGIASNHFKLSGFLESKGNQSNFDLKIKGEDGNIETVIDFLPEQYQSYLQDFKSKGAFTFLTTIKGKLNDKEMPAVQANFGLIDGSISSDKLGNRLRDVNFTARFTNGKGRSNRSSIFEIQDFNGFFGSEKIESKLRVSNFDDPQIDFSLNGVLPLASVYGLLNQPLVTDGTGEIEIKNLKLKGRYKDMVRTSRISRVETAGAIEFDDAGLTINGEDIILDKGALVIQDNSLIVKDIVIEGPGTEIELSGSFLNFIPVLFADSINSNRAELRFEANLNASKIDFDQLIAITENPIKEGQVAKAVYDSIQVAHTQKWSHYMDFLKGEFNTQIDYFNYREIEGEDFRGIFDFNHKVLTVRGDTKAMEGEFNLDGKAYFEEEPYLKAKVIADQVNIKEFFRQGENFGQDVVGYEHLKGKLEAKLTIDAHWDKEGNYVGDKLHVLGDLAIKNGELIGFKMLYDFADFIKMKDLRHIKFTNMRNWLEIHKETVYIPAMFLQSNALNMTISGEHDLEHNIDYGIKVNAAQVLFAKFKKYNPKKRAQPAQKKGWFNIYYRIFGTVDDYDIENDKRTVKKKFTLSENRKRDIQQKLKAAFGNKIDIYNEPSDWNDEDDIPEYDKEEEGDDEYIWGDEG